MKLRTLAILTLAALPLSAQEKKPAPAKPDKAAEARAALNKAKQDLRNKDRVKEAEAAIKKALKNNDAAKAELDRMKKKEEVPGDKDARATIERLKNSVDKNDMKEFEALLKDSSEAMKEELRAYQEKRRKEGRPETAPSPNVAPDPPPVSFDSVPAPAPMPLTKGPEFPVSPMVKADNGIMCGEHDPRHPDVLLAASDPLRRTWVLTGNVRIRRPFMALDADEVDLLLKEGEEANFNSAGGAKTDPPGSDPMGRGKKKSGPFERIVARGRVRVMFIDATGRVQVGRGGSMVYEEKSGVFLIKEWPEAEIGDKLLRGPEKSSVIKLSNITAKDPDGVLHGLETLTLENRLTSEDLPRTPDKPVPAAGPVKPKAEAVAPSPAPR